MTSPKNPRLPQLSALDAHRIHQWLLQYFAIETEATDLGQIFHEIKSQSWESGVAFGKMSKQLELLGEALPRDSSD